MIRNARKKLEVVRRTARRSEKKTTIAFPAKLVVHGAVIKDELSDWNDVLHGLWYSAGTRCQHDSQSTSLINEAPAQRNTAQNDTDHDGQSTRQVSAQDEHAMGEDDGIIIMTTTISRGSHKQDR